MAAEAPRTRRARSFDEVLEQLREAILSGRIRPGDRLPGERQLCESFGVGRPTLREALRSLEATGLIEVRPGKGGGSYAVTPSEATVGDALAALVNLRGASLEDLAEFRVDFEAENAGWAARRADAGDISALEALVSEARAAAQKRGARGELARIDVRWHKRRFSVKPGITCLWQVNGRNTVTFGRWMEMDKEYVENWSIWLDVKILARTLPVVLLRRGAS